MHALFVNCPPTQSANRLALAVPLASPQLAFLPPACLTHAARYRCCSLSRLTSLLYPMIRRSPVLRVTQPSRCVASDVCQAIDLKPTCAYSEISEVDALAVCQEAGMEGSGEGGPRYM